MPPKSSKTGSSRKKENKETPGDEAGDSTGNNGSSQNKSLHSVLTKIGMKKIKNQVRIAIPQENKTMFASKTANELHQVFFLYLCLDMLQVCSKPDPSSKVRIINPKLFSKLARGFSAP